MSGLKLLEHENSERYDYGYLAIILGVYKLCIKTKIKQFVQNLSDQDTLKKKKSNHVAYYGDKKC